MDQIHVWLYTHRFGEDVFLFDKEYTQDQVLEWMKKEGIKVELDRWDEFLENLGVKDILNIDK